MEEKASLLATSWVDIREKVVEQAITDGDYEALRRISALPGGFGSEAMRRRVWPVLLQVDRFCSADEKAEREAREAHKDEAQVSLDTNRSFVVYPTGIDSDRKQAMKEDLQDLIVGVLRRYPTLSYFQGYHDILSIFYLTFIPPLPSTLPRSKNHSRSSSRQIRKGQIVSETVGGEDEKVPILPDPTTDRDTPDWDTLRRCAEAVSVLRVRDAMGSGMEGMMGMLRILKRMLKAADPELSRFSAQISPVPTLPFFALSWILCLFSHDIDTLEPVQRMFDYLLARNPVSAIYLAVAILIAKKPQMLRLAKDLGPDAQDDPSLLHPLFSRLPPLYPDTPDQPEPIAAQTPSKARGDENDDPNPYSPIPLGELFQLADKLMLEHPWDGPHVRGGEVMGEGSVVYSYEREMLVQDEGEQIPARNAFSLEEALELVDQEVVKPGIGMDDSEAEEEVSRPVKKRIRRRRTWYSRLKGNKAGTTIAVGVVLLGMGMALFGVRAGGVDASWAGWWAVVIGKWAGMEGLGEKLGDAARSVGRLQGIIVRSLRDLR